MLSGGQTAVMGDELAIPELVAKHVAGLETIRGLVDRIVRERNPEGLHVIKVLDEALVAERATFEKLLADFRAGITNPVDDPLTRQLIEALAVLTMIGYDQLILSLRPRPAVAAAFNAHRHAERSAANDDELAG
jgi:hypothetical protein